jgi:hypothetical protein
MDTEQTLPKINFDVFDLPFVSDTDPENEEEIPEGRHEKFEFMKGQVPKNSIFLGELDAGIDGSPGMSWIIEDYYYLMPWEGDEYDWALFRISWDDNWGRFDWTTSARIKGTTDSREASRLMFKGLMDSWGYDLNDEDYAPYREFFEGI